MNVMYCILFEFMVQIVKYYFFVNIWGYPWIMRFQMLERHSLTHFHHWLKHIWNLWMLCIVFYLNLWFKYVVKYYFFVNIWEYSWIMGFQMLERHSLTHFHHWLKHIWNLWMLCIIFYLNLWFKYVV